MSARQQLAAALSAALPATYLVRPTNRVPDQVTTRTVLVWQDHVEPYPPAGPDAVALSLSVVLLSGYQGDAVEDDLEAGLLDLIAAIRPLAWCTWDRAERGTFADDTYQGYRITITAGGAVTDQEDTTP